MAEQTRSDELSEMPAVRTTIVGGRPPGSGTMIGQIPRGIEVLVKKASVDGAFKAVLLAARSKAAAEIDLRLDPAEAAMLDAVPAAQLEAIIARTHVDESRRPAFLGKAAAVMLVALGASSGRGVAQDMIGLQADPPATQKVEPPRESIGIRPPATTQASKPATTQASQPATRPIIHEVAGITPAPADEVRVMKGVRADIPRPRPTPSEPFVYPPVDAENVKAALPNLDSDDFKVREAAQKELLDIGVGAVPIIRELLKDEKLTLEVRNRLSAVQQKLEATTRPAVGPREGVISLGIRMQ